MAETDLNTQPAAESFLAVVDQVLEEQAGGDLRTLGEVLAEESLPAADPATPVVSTGWHALEQELAHTQEQVATVFGALEQAVDALRDRLAERPEQAAAAVDASFANELSGRVDQVLAELRALPQSFPAPAAPEPVAPLLEQIAEEVRALRPTSDSQPPAWEPLLERLAADLEKLQPATAESLLPQLQPILDRIAEAQPALTPEALLPHLEPLVERIASEVQAAKPEPVLPTLEPMLERMSEEIRALKSDAPQESLAPVIEQLAAEIRGLKQPGDSPSGEANTAAVLEAVSSQMRGQLEESVVAKLESVAAQVTALEQRISEMGTGTDNLVTELATELRSLRDRIDQVGGQATQATPPSIDLEQFAQSLQAAFEELDRRIKTELKSEIETVVSARIGLIADSLRQEGEAASRKQGRAVRRELDRVLYVLLGTLSLVTAGGAWLAFR